MMPKLNWRKAFTIFLSEMRYVLRDRTTIIMMIVLPMIAYPVITIAHFPT